MKKTLAFCLLALVATAAWAGQAAETKKPKAKPAAKAPSKPSVSPDGNLLPNGDFNSGKVTPTHPVTRPAWRCCRCPPESSPSGPVRDLC